MVNGQAVQDQDGRTGFVKDESFDLALQLLELTDMRAEGTITEEEFAQWKEDLFPA
jgi:hypothetical protein